MDVIVDLNSQTAGRENLARLLEHASKAGWHYMQQKGINRESIDRIKNLEYTFNSFRRLLRLGRFLDMLHGIPSSIHYQDIVVRITCTLSKMANALFLLADHILWMGRTGLANVNMEKWNEVAARFTLYSVTMNLFRDVYEIWRILRAEYERLGNTTDPTQKSFSLGIIRAALNYHKPVVVDTVKNVCDVMLPLASLGYLRLSPGAIGLLGIASSLAAIIRLIDPSSRLSPA